MYEVMELVEQQDLSEEVMELVAEQQDLSEEVSSAFQSSDFDIDELRNELHGIDKLHGMGMDEVNIFLLCRRIINHQMLSLGAING